MFEFIWKLFVMLPKLLKFKLGLQLHTNSRPNGHD